MSTSLVHRSPSNSQLRHQLSSAGIDVINLKQLIFKLKSAASQLLDLCVDETSNQSTLSNTEIPQQQKLSVIEPNYFSTRLPSTLPPTSTLFSPKNPPRILNSDHHQFLAPIAFPDHPPTTSPPLPPLPSLPPPPSSLALAPLPQSQSVSDVDSDSTPQSESEIVSPIVPCITCLYNGVPPVTTTIQFRGIELAIATKVTLPDDLIIAQIIGVPLHVGINAQLMDSECKSRPCNPSLDAQLGRLYNHYDYATKSLVKSFVRPKNPFVDFAFICRHDSNDGMPCDLQVRDGLTSLDLSRICISDHFGRNKVATRKITNWVRWCRKHYQRSSYDKETWPWKVIQLCTVQLRFIDDEFPGIRYTVVMKKQWRDQASKDRIRYQRICQHIDLVFGSQIRALATAATLSISSSRQSPSPPASDFSATSTTSAASAWRIVDFSAFTLPSSDSTHDRQSGSENLSVYCQNYLNQFFCGTGKSLHQCFIICDFIRRLINANCLRECADVEFLPEFSNVSSSFVDSSGPEPLVSSTCSTVSPFHSRNPSDTSTSRRVSRNPPYRSRKRSLNHLDQSSPPPSKRASLLLC